MKVKLIQKPTEYKLVLDNVGCGYFKISESWMGLNKLVHTAFENQWIILDMDSLSKSGTLEVLKLSPALAIKIEKGEET